MKGDAKVIEELNARLAEELTAINQYFVHAEMCEDWHYGRLAEAIKKRSITEMKHAEKLIERLLYLDGRPIVSNLNEMHIGALVPAMHANDLAAEIDAVKAYNASIRVCVEAARAPRKCSSRSSPTRKGMLTGWRRSSRRSSRWVSKSTWQSRWTRSLTRLPMGAGSSATPIPSQPASSCVDVSSRWASRKRWVP
jgi:bacterioferritin